MHKTQSVKRWTADGTSKAGDTEVDLGVIGVRMCDQSSTFDDVEDLSRIKEE